MSNFLSPVIRQQAWYLGVVAPGAVMRFFLSGTSTPQAVFTLAGVSLGTTLTADSSGRFAAFVLGPAAYRMTMVDSVGATIWGPEDNISNVLTSLDGGLVLGGLLDLSAAAAGQIKFPTTPDTSSNVNTLDDYKRGTWTPTIGGVTSQSGQVYSSQSGQFIKIGRFVYVWFRVTLSTLGTITGQVQIQGLPYPSQNTTPTPWGDVEIGWEAMTTSIVRAIGVLNANSSTVQLYLLAAAATSSFGTLAAQADLSATTTLRGQFGYLATT